VWPCSECPTTAQSHRARTRAIFGEPFFSFPKARKPRRLGLLLVRIDRIDGQRKPTLCAVLKCGIFARLSITALPYVGTRSLLTLIRLRQRRCAILHDPSLAPVSSTGFNVQLTQEWLQTCQKSHKECSWSIQPPLPRIPTRVLEIKLEEDILSLNLHATHGYEEAEYGCLSYAWGGPQPMMLSTSTLQSFQAGIRFDELLPALQGAIRMTKDLGFCYLWIDALCILQDSDQDKGRELTRMQTYYRNSTLCLQPIGLRSVHETFLKCTPSTSSEAAQPHSFQEYDLDHVRVLDLYSSKGHMDRVVLEIDPKVYHEPDEPLNQREWVLQERILSPRVLVLPSVGGLIWQCDELQTFEGKIYSFAGNVHCSRLSDRFNNQKGDNALSQ
jgi:hypothetical protein